ncbi:sugar ABC transporter permease [soil metagenome]
MEHATSAGPETDNPVSGNRLDRNAKFIFLAPTVFYLLLLGIFPLIFSLYMVFAQWRAREISWVGMQNLNRLFEQDRFYNSVKLTILFVLIVTLAELILGTLVALGLQSTLRGKNGFRLLFTLPMLLPPIAVAYTWRTMFDYNQGPLNYFLSELGLNRVGWLGHPQWAFFSIAIVDIWQWTPFIALGVLAALESQSTELYEAATVDGASWWQLVKDLALPLLAPYAIALVALRSIDAFKVVDTIFILTGGGPGTSTELLTFYGYVAGFRPFNMGYTSAVAWSLVVMMTIVFFILLRVLRRADEEF